MMTPTAFEFTREHLTSLTNIDIVMAFLGIIASMLMLKTYFKKDEESSITIKCLNHITFAGFCFAFSAIAGVYRGKYMGCILEGYLYQFAKNSTIYWTTAHAFVVYMSIVNEEALSKIDDRLIAKVGYYICIIFSALPAMKYGCEYSALPWGMCGVNAGGKGDFFVWIY